MIGDTKGYCVLTNYDDRIFIGLDERFNKEAYDDIKKLIIRHALKIIDISVDNKDFMIIEPKGRALVQIPKECCFSYFECNEMNNIILPVCKNFTELMFASIARFPIYQKDFANTRRIVMTTSLALKKFDDSFLFKKEEQNGQRNND